MEYAFKLEINILSKCNIYFLENILELHGTEINESQWNYTIEIGEKDEWVDFISIFYDSLIGKFDMLETIGIKKEDITIWYYYEYDQQCNMEFSPKDLAKLGELGITFCISCWEK